MHMDRQLTDFCSCAFGRQSSERIHSPCRCSQRSVYIIEPGRHYTDKDAEYICGFSGSAGTAVVTLDKAALATDGRYFNQAEKQLDSNWELLKQGMQDVLTWQEWFVVFSPMEARRELTLVGLPRNQQAARPLA